MPRSAHTRRTATLAAGAAAVGLAAVAFAGSAQAATAAPAGGTHTTMSPRQAGTPATGEATNLGLTTREAQAIQRFVAARYGYTGPIDGRLGTDSWMGLQRELVRFGTYTGPIDGIVDAETIAALQGLLAPPIAGYTGPIDGTDNPETEAAFARYAETLIEEDGV